MCLRGEVGRRMENTGVLKRKKNKYGTVLDIQYELYRILFLGGIISLFSMPQGTLHEESSNNPSKCYHR